jgi:hypothetical protein
VQLDAFGKYVSWYFALHSLNLLLQTVYVLRLLNFQPRLGIVTRSLAFAARDLSNFLLMLSIIMLLYAASGHILFGNALVVFSTFSQSMDTCLGMLMGDIAPGAELRGLLNPLRTLGGFYFWSFMILVHTLLLNFVLAIICDAFCEVKEATAGSSRLWEDIWSLLKDRMLHMTGERLCCTPAMAFDTCRTQFHFIKHHSTLTSIGLYTSHAPDSFLLAWSSTAAASFIVHT